MQLSSARTLLCSGLLGCLLISTAGCEPTLGTPTTLTGKVTVDGEPLSNAALAFHATQGGMPAEYRTFTAKTDASGKYMIPEIYPGKYEVTVVDTSAPSGQADSGAESAAVGGQLRPADSEELTVEIGSKPARFDIQLTRTEGDNEA